MVKNKEFVKDLEEVKNILGREDIEIVGYIYKTTTPCEFETLKGNRDINANKVDHIVKSMREDGILPTIETIDDNGRLFDGQHRHEALTRLAQGDTFTMIRNLEEEDCKTYNMNASSWGTDDIIKHYADMGNKNYQRLLALHTLYPDVTPLAIAHIKDRKIKCGGGATQPLKNGKFIMTMDDYNRVEKQLAFLKQYENGVKRFGATAIPNTAQTLFAWLYDCPKCNNRVLTKILTDNNILFDLTLHKDDMLHKFSELYTKIAKRTLKKGTTDDWCIPFDALYTIQTK